MTPTVASYCTTFLKPEMLHIYRQVTGLQRYRTFIVTKERKCADRFPFDDIVTVPRKPGKNFIRRFYLKHIRKLPPIYYRGELQGLAKIFQHRPTNLMHIYFGHTGVHLLPFIERWDRPCIVSFHGADVMLREHKPGYDEQLRQLLKTMPLVLARSLSLSERLQAIGCPPEKIRLNRTGIPLERYPFAPRRCPCDGEWRFVQACRLIPKKGLRTALQAFAQFRRKHPRATFSIAGEGPMRGDLEKLVAQLGLRDAVFFPGFLDQEALNALYGESHVFLHPSELTEDQNQEGIPNSMLEAMSSGLPVVATLHGGIPEAVEHERTGLLVPERDADALAAALSRITDSFEYLQAVGRCASESIHVNFEQGKAIENLEACYDEATEIWRANGGLRNPPRKLSS